MTLNWDTTYLYLNQIVKWKSNPLDLLLFLVGHSPVMKLLLIVKGSTTISIMHSMTPKLKEIRLNF